MEPLEHQWYSSSLKAGRLKAQDEPVLQSEGHQAQENLSYSTECCFIGASQVDLVVKNLPANAGDLRDAGLIPGLGRSSGGGHGNPPQYSCLENPMDRGAWQVTVHGVTQSQTRLKRLSMHTLTNSMKKIKQDNVMGCD